MEFTQYSRSGLMSFMISNTMTKLYLFIFRFCKGMYRGRRWMRCSRSPLYDPQIAGLDKWLRNVLGRLDSLHLLLLYLIATPRHSKTLFAHVECRCSSLSPLVHYWIAIVCSSRWLQSACPRYPPRPGGLEIARKHKQELSQLPCKINQFSLQFQCESDISYLTIDSSVAYFFERSLESQCSPLSWRSLLSRSPCAGLWNKSGFPN